MYTHANMICKDPKIAPEVCQIVAIRELSASRFDHFRTHLLEDQDFITDVTEELHGTDQDGTRCLLVLGEGYPYGILVNSEGSDYARYSGILPHARQMVEKHLDQMADYCVREGITHSDDGSWMISFDELYEHFGTEVKPNNGWGEMLLEKIKQQAEVDEIIATEDEFEIQYHLENCPECRQGGIDGAMSLISLMGCNLINIHLRTEDGIGNEQMIPELNTATLTEEGKREFADVLNAEVVHLSGGTIALREISFDRIRRFSAVLCNECPMEEYYKFVAPKSGEVRTKYATITQDMIDIASAKHTLWRLDQPSGEQAVFSHCDFYRLRFDGKDFNGATFEDCRFYDCSADRAEFCCSSFAQSRIKSCGFNDAYIEDADFSNTEIVESEFKFTELSGSNFTDAKFEDVDVDDARMMNCNFTGTEFGNTDIEVANTSGSVYRQEDWEELWEQNQS